MPLLNFNDLDALPNLMLGEIWNKLSEVIALTGHNADTVIIPYGYAVSFPAAGTIGFAAGTPLVLPVDATTPIRGIALANNSHERRDSAVTAGGLLGYPVRSAVGNLDRPNYLMSYLVRGVIGVQIDQDVTRLSPVFARHTVGGVGTGTKGVFRTDADTARALQIVNAEYLVNGTALAGSIVPLWLK